MQGVSQSRPMRGGDRGGRRGGRGGDRGGRRGGRGGSRAPMNVSGLDRDLDAYMMRSNPTAVSSSLDAELESYMGHTGKGLPVNIPAPNAAGTATSAEIAAMLGDL